MANVFGNITDWLSGGQLGQGQDAFERAAQIVAQTGQPDLMALIPNLQKQVQAGSMTPAQAAAAIQDSSAFQNISTNPSLTQDQLSAIDQLKQVATQGGLTAMDKAQLLDIQNQQAAQNHGQQQALQTSFAQQGQGGQGAEQQARMLASQGNANAASNAGAQVAANAQARALQAMQAYGQGAQSAQNQQFNQQAQAASAQNAINQFNAANRQQTGLANQQAQQQANQANFQMANQIGAKNTDIANQQAMLPQQTAQQQYQNLFNRNVGASNALLKQGSALMDQGNKQASNTGTALNAAGNFLTSNAGQNALSTIGSTLGNWGSSLADTVGSWFSDEEMKHDVSPADQSIEEMMSKLVGKHFKYDNDTVAADGEKPHVGVMAQDAARAGLNVAQTPDGKKILDDPEMKGRVLAALGNLHRRVGQLETKNG